MIGEAKVLYYCDSCTAELEIALTATAAGWAGDYIAPAGELPPLADDPHAPGSPQP